jgi:ATP-dependent DNA helicase RecQ
MRDLRINKFLIEKDRENQELDPEELERLQKAQKQRLRRMVEYCHSTSCLRREILSYFGENPPASCGNCGNCLRKVNLQDITIDAQKILSCVKRMKERYGLTLLMQTLRGSRSKKVLELEFDKLSTYGIMRQESERSLRRKIDFLLAREYMELTEDDFPVLRTTPLGRDVLFRGVRVTMPFGEDEARPSLVRTGSSGSSAAPDPEEEALFERFRELRKTLAKEEGVPAFVIFSDATLRDLSAKRPRNLEELLDVEGIGYSKRAKYGEAFLKALEEHAKAG